MIYKDWTFKKRAKQTVAYWRETWEVRKRLCTFICLKKLQGDDSWEGSDINSGVSV